MMIYSGQQSIRGTTEIVLSMKIRTYSRRCRRPSSRAATSLHWIAKSLTARSGDLLTYEAWRTDFPWAIKLQTLVRLPAEVLVHGKTHRSFRRRHTMPTWSQLECDRGRRMKRVCRERCVKTFQSNRAGAPCVVPFFRPTIPNLRRLLAA